MYSNFENFENGNVTVAVLAFKLLKKIQKKKQQTKCCYIFVYKQAVLSSAQTD